MLLSSTPYRATVLAVHSTCAISYISNMYSPAPHELCLGCHQHHQRRKPLQTPIRASCHSNNQFRASILQTKAQRNTSPENRRLNTGTLNTVLYLPTHFRPCTQTRQSTHSRLGPSWSNSTISKYHFTAISRRRTNTCMFSVCLLGAWNVRYLVFARDSLRL